MRPRSHAIPLFNRRRFETCVQDKARRKSRLCEPTGRGPPGMTYIESRAALTRVRTKSRVAQENGGTPPVEPMMSRGDRPERRRLPRALILWCLRLPVVRLPCLSCFSPRYGHSVSNACNGRTFVRRPLAMGTARLGRDREDPLCKG